MKATTRITSKVALDKLPPALRNARLVREYRCAQCWGALVEKFVEGAYTVVCPKACTPGGYVTQSFVEQRKAEGAAERAEVAKNYPQFDDAPKVDRRAAREALYGEG